MSSNSTPDLFWALDLTTDLMYSNFLFWLHLLNSSRPKITSLARAVVRSLKTDTSDPGWSQVTLSTSRSFDGVENGSSGGHRYDGCCTGNRAG